MIGGPPCERRNCQCTHEPPCDRGWIDLEPRMKHGQTYERVGPCPMCRPEAAARLDRNAR